MHGYRSVIARLRLAEQRPPVSTVPRNHLVFRLLKPLPIVCRQKEDNQQSRNKRFLAEVVVVLEGEGKRKVIFFKNRLAVALS